MGLNWFKQNAFHFFSFLVITIFGFFLLKDFLNFGLCCDDIRLIHIAKTHEQYNIRPPKKFFFDPYGSQYLYAYLIYRIHGLNPYFYFLYSILLRILASCGVYIFALKLLKNKYLALISATLFVSSFAGIETTEGTVNSSSYLGIFFISISIPSFIDYISTSPNKILSGNFLLYILFLLAAFVVAPVRMPGFTFLVLATELTLIWLKKTHWKNAGLRIAIYSTIMITLKNVGFFGTGGNTASKTPEELLILLKSFELKGLLYPFATYSELLFPPSLRHHYANVTQQFVNSPTTTAQVLVIFIILSTAVLLISLKKKQSNLFIALILSWIISLITLKLAYSNKIDSSGITTFYGLALVHLVIFAAYKMYIAGHKYLSLVTLFLLSWPFAFFVITQIYYPNQLIDSYQRYMIFPIVGIYILLSLFLTKLFAQQQILAKLLSGAVLVICIVYNVTDIRNYINTKKPYRSAIHYEQVFDVMNSEISKHQSISRRPIIFLTSDDPTFTYFAVLYGGQERFALENNNFSSTFSPLFLTDRDDVIKISYDKQIAQKHGIPIPQIEDIFAFDIQKKQAKSQTEKLREEITHTTNDILNTNI